MSAPVGENPPVSDTTRAEDLAAGLAAVEHRIAAACERVGRPREDVTLVAVTKFFPAADAATLLRLGVTDIGESRDQEASAKIAELTASGGQSRHHPRVHFIGQVQSNKAGSVARYADVVESIDRAKLVGALERGAQACDRDLDVLIQVSLDGDTGRGGVAVDGVGALAERIAATQRLRLRGVMAVAPLGADPDDAFARLREVSRELRRDHPEATWISAGMTADLEQAIARGATHVRVGSAILGARPPAR